MIFVGIFIHLLERRISPTSLCFSTISTSAVGWVLCSLLEPRLKEAKPASQSTAGRKKRGPVAVQIGRLLSLLLLALVLFALSPLLRTLTEATTSDSIWALTSALLALNIALADYSTVAKMSSGSASLHPSSTAAPAPRAPSYIVAGKAPEVGGGLAVKVSFNAAVCASVVLASRLQSNAEVFSLLLVSMQVFAFAPLFRTRMVEILQNRASLHLHPFTRKRRENGTPLPIPSTDDFAHKRSKFSVQLFQAVLFLATLIAALSIFSTLQVEWTAGGMLHTPRPGVQTATVLHFAIIVFVSLICPAWMRASRKHKRRLNGPWDPAVPIIRAPEG